MPIGALLSAFWARLQGWVVAIGATLTVVGGAYLAGRRSGRVEAQRDAAFRHIETRDRADEAASAAARDGADRRLREGNF